MSDFPLCEAARLEMTDNPSLYYVPTWISAKDVEAYLAKITKALNLALYYVEGDATYEGLLPRIAEVLGHEVQPNKKCTPKGDDPMTKMSDGFFKPSDFAAFMTTDGQRKFCADQANRLLQERGTVVYGCDGNADIAWFTDSGSCDTHQALLINIREIEKADTAEGLLREFCAVYDKQDRGDIPVKYLEVGRKLYNRAKKLLDKSK